MRLRTTRSCGLTGRHRSGRQVNRCPRPEQSAVLACCDQVRRRITKIWAAVDNKLSHESSLDDGTTTPADGHVDVGDEPRPHDLDDSMGYSPTSRPSPTALRSPNGPP